MAVIKFTNSKSGLKKILRYITQSEKTDVRLVSGQECMPETALEEMRAVKRMHGKEHGRQYIHIVQAFHPDENITHEQAHEIGRQLAARFSGFQAVIATHRDRDHIHTHVVLNSVAFESGLKFQQSKQDMQAVKDYSDELCRGAGLSVIEKTGRNAYIPQDVYHLAVKGDSWKFRLMNAIDHAMATSRKKDEFIAVMRAAGYAVVWADARQHITYTTPEGMKCRDNKLYDVKYTKEAMEYEFGLRESQENKREYEGTARTATSQRNSQRNGQRDQRSTDAAASARVSSMPGQLSATRGMAGDDGEAEPIALPVGGFAQNHGKRGGAGFTGKQGRPAGNDAGYGSLERDEPISYDAIVNYDPAADGGDGAGAARKRGADQGFDGQALSNGRNRGGGRSDVDGDNLDGFLSALAEQERAARAGEAPKRQRRKEQDWER